MMLLVTLFVVISLTVGLAVLLIGRPSFARRRDARSAGRLPDSAAVGQLVEPVWPVTRSAALDVRLRTVLEVEGDVLLGYTTHAVRSGAAILPAASSRSATGTLLLRPGPDTRAVPVLDRWRQDGIVLELRITADSDVVMLSDLRSPARIYFNQLRAPR
jgi:hypothetical protein